jgi:tetratricopeptide (TPR) repeat protein
MPELSLLYSTCPKDTLEIKKQYTMATISERIAAIPRECIECDASCGKANPKKKCSRCHLVYYCSAECQKKHWAQHKSECRSIESMKLSMMGLAEDVPVSFPQSSSGINTECCICLAEEIERPVVLESCRHAFCAACLIEWQRVVPLSQVQREKCPLCRSECSNVEASLLEKARMHAARANRRDASDEVKTSYREQALEEIDKFLRVDQPHLQAFFTKAEILRSLGDPAGAISTLNQMTEQDDQRQEEAAKVESLLQRAEAADTEGDEVALLDEAESLQKKMGNRLGGGKARLFDLKLLQAYSYQDMKKWEEAIRIYISMFEAMDGTEVGSPVQQRKIFMGISQCFYETGKYEKSISSASAAIEMNPYFPGVYKFKALSQRAKGELGEAVKTMTRAVLYETPWDDDNRAEALKLYDELSSEL